MFDENIGCEQDYPSPTKILVGNDSPGPLQILKRRKSEIEQRLAKVNQAIDTLEKNPDISAVFDLVTKGLRA